MIPLDIPVGTPIVHTTYGGLRRAGHTTGPVTTDITGRKGLAARLEDGTQLIAAALSRFELANPYDLDPPQLSLFTLETP